MSIKPLGDLPWQAPKAQEHFICSSGAVVIVHEQFLSARRPTALKDANLFILLTALRGGGFVSGAGKLSLPKVCLGPTISPRGN